MEYDLVSACVNMSDNMKIVKIKGGLGNQLFQYAFALLLKKKTNGIVKLDFSSCYGTSDVTCEDRLKLFSISIQEASPIDIKKNCRFYNKYPLSTLKYRLVSFMSVFFDKHYYFEKKREFRDVDELLDYRYFDGYWQSWKYVSEVSDELTKELVPNETVSRKTKDTIDKVSSENSVFIGIRRGDYSSSQSARSIYGSFDVNYYLNAMKRMATLIDNPVFYVFSNDVEWCKKSINWDGYSVIFREKDEQASDFEELLIMSNCKNAIIVNSTFHWWGAFLIKNKNKVVIAPTEWHVNGDKMDIIPPGWIRMKRNGEFEE